MLVAAIAAEEVHEHGMHHRREGDVRIVRKLGPDGGSLLRGQFLDHRLGKLEGPLIARFRVRGNRAAAILALIGIAFVLFVAFLLFLILIVGADKASLDFDIAVIVHGNIATGLGGIGGAIGFPRRQQNRQPRLNGFNARLGVLVGLTRFDFRREVVVFGFQQVDLGLLLLRQLHLMRINAAHIVRVVRNRLGGFHPLPAFHAKLFALGVELVRHQLFDEAGIEGEAAVLSCRKDHV
ncbi:hypothetical protein shn_31590 (plasmid) [Shinella sp. HZN7]|nr:hypothetical protein shn_31590 [Shinella sp. HZN7]